MKISWVYAYAMFLGLWTYWCTRGPDGRFVATLAGFSVFAIIYWSLTYQYRPLPMTSLLWHLLVVEFAVTVALTVRPELDEMAGILNLFIPSIVLAIVLGGYVLSRIPRTKP